MMDEAVPYSRDTVAVEGGRLAYGRWGDPSSPAVIALHGVTSTHLDWLHVGRGAHRHLQVIAPDLRGRGGSSDITGPWGMDAHAHDVIALIDHLGLGRAVLVGHSMGGFVAVMTAVRFPERVSGILLVDGGLPAVEANAGGDELTRIVLDGARARLEQRFSSPQEHLEALAAQVGAPLDADAAQIARYDLVDAGEGALRIAGSYAAIEADATHITGDASDQTLRRLMTPALLLRAGRGLPPREEGLYSPREVAEWTARVASLESIDLPGADHGSIIRDPEHVAEVVRRAAALHDL
jgi:pimeloyl-ACP methyl ester carboxylesterase